MSSPQDTHTSATDEKLFYESSNGDTWYLGVNPATGTIAVKHVANPQSGGHVSYSEVEGFLATGNGPEHQALRQLLKNERLSTILIAFDIHPRQGSGYHDLGEAIQSLGAWWHHLETVWIVRSNKTPVAIRDHLKAYIGSDDQLLVVDITGDGIEWAGVNETGSSWLRENIDRDSLMA